MASYFRLSFSSSAISSVSLRTSPQIANVIAKLPMGDSLVTPGASKVSNKDLGKYFHQDGDTVSEREEKWPQRQEHYHSQTTGTYRVLTLTIQKKRNLRKTKQAGDLTVQKYFNLEINGESLFSRYEKNRQIAVDCEYWR